MTLQRRLFISILLAAPVAWLLTIAVTYWRAELEINELYDTDMVRMAQQTYALLPLFQVDALDARRIPQAVPRGSQGDAVLGDVAMSAWAPDGRNLRIERDTETLPKRDGTHGFADVDIAGTAWRVYYLEDERGGWRVAVGQRLGERDELIMSNMLGQIVPWLVGLPILMLLMGWSVRRALRPVRELSRDIEHRSVDDPTPLDVRAVPGEIAPLGQATNRLMARASASIEHERRLTADAAHELRTPLAALRSQWEVVQRATDPAERLHAGAKLELGIERLNRLVSQLLAMARLENVTQAGFTGDVSWPRVAEQAISDCLALAQRKNVDIEVIWPPAGAVALPVTGDEHLLVLLLRNLVDNATRYSADGGLVTLRFLPDSIEIEDCGPGVSPDQLERLGDRFFRMPGQQEQGSGLGLSIARRVARIQGLEVTFANRMRGVEIDGFVATVRRESRPPALA